MPRGVESVDDLVRMARYCIYRLEQLSRALYAGQQGRALVKIARGITIFLRGDVAILNRKMRILQYFDKANHIAKEDRFDWGTPETVVADFWEERGDQEAADFLRECARIDKIWEKSSPSERPWLKADEWNRALESIGPVPDWGEDFVEVSEDE